MTGQELIIIFKKDKAYLSDDFSLSFDAVELGEVAQRRGFRNTAFWIIKVLSHHPNEGRINVEVLSYNIGETVFSTFQKSISEELRTLKKIIFKSIDTSGLLLTLAGGQKSTIYPSKSETVDREQDKYTKSNNSPKQITFKPIPIIIKETFYVPLKKVRFKLGGVSFDKKFKEYKNTVELTILNYDIREEFDAVKNYFANVLKTKKIEVSVIIELTAGVITSTEVRSPEIEKINKELIDVVKFEFVKTIAKKKISAEMDKTLFTMDEYFDTLSESKVKSSAFYSDDKQLLDDLLHISNTKHYKNLRFLSSQHLHEIMKLRIIIKPFSFIFLMEGNRHYHIIWETLDTSEATYIWQVEKNIPMLKMTLRKIEDIINVTRVQGKSAYIISNEDQFRRIYHDYSDIVEGFVKWKGELESCLT